jgi:hypothetical protein
MLGLMFTHALAARASHSLGASSGVGSCQNIHSVRLSHKSSVQFASNFSLIFICRIISVFVRSERYTVLNADGPMSRVLKNVILERESFLT